MIVNYTFHCSRLISIISRLDFQPFGQSTMIQGMQAHKIAGDKPDTFKTARKFKGNKMYLFNKIAACC